MHTVVETPPYLRSVEGLLTAEERQAVVDMVSQDQGCGQLMPGTGGFRKVRFARSGTGKRGGLRLIYIVRRNDMPVFLIAAYAKNAKENLTMDERNKLAKRADEIFDEYRRVR